MFDVQLTDSDTGADLTFGAHQVHLLAQVIKELPFSILICFWGFRDAWGMLQGYVGILLDMYTYVTTHVYTGCNPPHL